MVEEGSSKFHRISFEEIQKTLRGSTNIRAAVIRYLVQEFGGEVAKHFEVAPRSARKSASKK